MTISCCKPPIDRITASTFIPSSNRTRSEVRTLDFRPARHRLLLSFPRLIASTFLFAMTAYPFFRLKANPFSSSAGLDAHRSEKKPALRVVGCQEKILGSRLRRKYDN